MTKTGEKSRRIAATITAALAAACLAAPAGAAIPSVDEYTLPAPNAKGQGNVTKQPVAHPEDLPPSVRRSLAQHPDRAALELAATSPELGAPGPAGASTAAAESDDRALPAATVNALGTPGLLVVVLALGGLGFLAYARRRGVDRP